MPSSGTGLKAPNTLAVDVGGTGIKASVLDSSGAMEHDRVRVPTPYPLSPQKLVQEIEKLIQQLPAFDRVSVGFPGMVRGGQILSAPHFISPTGPGGKPEPKLVTAWGRFDLAAALQEATGKPTKVANDADLQGAAVVEGKGFEAVVTLGTGVGTAFFLDGRLLPHFEFAHTPLGKNGSYNDVLGEATRKRIGVKKWRRRVLDAIETLRALTFFDRMYIGGGNSARLGDGLPEGVSIVDNTAGVLGGIKLWERTEPHTPVTAAPAKKAPPAKKAAPAKKAPPAKKVAPAKKAPAVKKAPAAKKAAPPAEAVPVGEPAPAAEPAPFPHDPADQPPAATGPAPFPHDPADPAAPDEPPASD